MGKRSLIITPENIESDLAACKVVFDKLDIPWIIMGGVVLGYARYNAIMEWDTDLDIGVLDITRKKQLKLLESLKGVGFRINLSQEDFKCGSRKVPFNLWFFHTNGNFCEAFPKSTPGLKFVEKVKWYTEPQVVEFLESEYPMPNHMEDYLVGQYGDDWRTNIVKDHEAYYLDKRGSRDTSKWLNSRGSKNGDLWPKTLRIKDSMEG